jgi:uncharacterized protein YdeI (YjbR/CyaY-like superfamily)
MSLDSILQLTTRASNIETFQMASPSRHSVCQYSQRLNKFAKTIPMPSYDPRIDAYIAKSADFAKPVMEHLRELIHEVCPDVQETIKWGMPSFEYKGILCGFAAFKQHCTFGFWKHAILAEKHEVLKNSERAAMGSFGKMTSMKDLPSDKVLKMLIKDAMKLNEDGIAQPNLGRKTGVKRAEISEPDYFTKTLVKNKKAKATWEAFSPSCRREYLEWITEAKTEPTREKRLTQTMEWLAEGKKRNWKYEKC